MTGAEWADIAVVSIIVVSVLVSILRGFVKEAISLTTWLIAAGVAIKFCHPLSASLTFITMDSLRVIVSFLLIFVVIVFIGALVNYLVGSLIRKTPFSLPDRVLGTCFGAFRGGLLVSLLVLLGGLTQLPSETWWKDSTLIPKFQVVAVWLKQQLPSDISEHFNFSVEKKSDEA